MEALYVQPWDKDGVMVEEEEKEKSGEGMEASFPTGSTTDEDTDEDSEPEPPLLIRRKVSFADAFGLNLVSVKEFKIVEVAESEVSLPPEREPTRPLEEFYMSCLFTVPSSPEELDQRLQAQMVELESIELLPGTTTIRGLIRVVNLCYTKSVYARMSLDRWASYFDLLAEYVPGSSDRKTDRFTFKYILVPPFKREGTRVEFCLRYDTSAGTFWANNKEMNYVLFCHQRGHANEPGPQVQEESAGYKSRRSCLKANRRGSAEEKTRETSNTSTSTVVEEAGATDQAEEADRKMTHSAEIQSLLCRREHKPLVDGVKSRHRATRLARVQDYFSQRRLHEPKACSHDSADGQKVSQPLPSTWGDSASFPQKRQKKQPNESLQVLTYHQIPLLTLDWNNDKAHEWGTAHMDDIWTGRAQMTLENIEDTPTVNDMWETFHNCTDDTTDTEASVCDVWQAFLNGPSCTDHSGVPESEWLQTAASVSPSNDKEPKSQYAASSQEHEFQVGADTPTTLHTSAACQLLPDTCETSLANVTLNTADRQPAEACVSSPGDDNTATQDASQRSKTNSITNTLQEFSLEGATPVSEGSVDSSTVCHKHTTWERERDGIIGGAGGIGGDEPFTPHTADLVTSSGESETTDMTAAAESPNASAVDRISQGARLAEGLSSSREGQVTGTVHNAKDDTLVFKGTIRPGTKDRERFVFSTSRQGEEEGIMNNSENKVSTGEEIFRPQKTDKCEISQRYADEKEHEEFRANQNSENPLLENESDENEIRPTPSHADEFNSNRTCDDNFKQSQIMSSEFKLEESQNDNAASNSKDSEGFEKTEVEPSYCTTSDKTRHTVESREMKKVFQSDHDVVGPFPTGKCNPKPIEEVEMRWTHSQDDMKGQREDVGHEINPEEVSAKEDIAKKDTSRELHRQPETLERIEEDMSQRDKDERVSIGKLKIEAVGELMTGNAGIPQGERKNAPAQLKEQELSAEVESSPRVEYKKLSEGTKDPITAENTEALEVIESGLEEMFVERFGEDLVRGIWEEVFNLKAQASNRDTNVVDGMAAVPDITQDCHLLFEKDFNDAFDSGIFSLTQLPSEPNSSPCQGLEKTLEAKSNEYSPKERSQPLATTEQTRFLSDSRTNLNSSAHLSQDLAPILAAQSRRLSTESAQSSPNDQENHTQIKERSVPRQETGRQIEERAVAHEESFNRSDHPTHKHLTSSSEKLKESKSLAWWSMLYILSHITRLLICILLVAGFFYIIYLCDFPAFFALYMFSSCWWFYKWKTHRATTNKGMVG